MSAVKEIDKPERGDVVLYRGKAYYFQGNGMSCYLYDRKDQFGMIQKARHCPSRRSVTKAPLGTTVIYIPTPEEIKLIEDDMGLHEFMEMRMEWLE